MTANMRRSTDQPDWRHWLTLAAEHRLAGEHEDAVTALRAARRSVLARSEPVGEANVLLMDGLLIQDAGDHTRAAELFVAVGAALDGVSGSAAATLRVHALTVRGALHRMHGEYRTAHRLLTQAALEAGDPDGRVAAHNELGMTARYAGRYDEAAEHYARARAELESAHGPDHPELATVHHNLSGLAHARGDIAEAQRAAWLAVEIRERALGPDHPATVADRGALAAVLISAGRVAEAETILEEVLAAVEQSYGGEHHEVAVVLHNLGSAAFTSGHHGRAGELLARSLALKEKALGPAHPELASTLCNLAQVLQANGQSAAAVELFRRAVAVLAADTETDHPIAVICREALQNLTS
ncbi:tetratricopeptide repeat protein [Pseudonocardia sp. GCM10023141]|uniref:tetratricopeptide repeat protein n=1 Tax=Pseudonocardia sp. GCM10023141 TaxID=3252653 RepID=UPI0036133262